MKVSDMIIDIDLFRFAEYIVPIVLDLFPQFEFIDFYRFPEICNIRFVLLCRT